MNLSTSKQFRNIMTVRKHRKQVRKKEMKEARRIMAEQLAKMKPCDCPECRAKRESPAQQVGNA